MKLLHSQIHGAKINGRKPRLDDFLPRKRKANGAGALLKAQAQVAAVRAKALEERKNQKNG